MWDYDSLYEKSKHFVHKGLNHNEPTSSEVPLWCILALELLARATLARIDRALLVDLKNENSLLSICGGVEMKNPTSATINTILTRCTILCSKFSETDKKKCIEWMNWRNAELHTGSSPLDGLRKSDWQPNFFRVCHIFLEENKTTLESFLGRRHANIAERMMESLSQEKKKEAHDKVREQKKQFALLDIETRLHKMAWGSRRAEAIPEKVALSNGVFIGIKVERCPCCEGDAVIYGRSVRSNNPREERGELVQEDTWFPSMLKCYCCDLILVGHAYLSGFDLGEPFTTKDVLDPIDYFQIGFVPEEDE